MSLIKNFFKGGSNGELSHCVVDGAGLAEGNRSGKLSPKNQIEILQYLSRIARIEKIVLEVVFEGQALRKVGHGKKFDSITVYFAKNSEALEKIITTRSRKSDCIVVTGNRSLEERIQNSGGETMHLSTFRKAFDRNDQVGNRNKRSRQQKKPQDNQSERKEKPRVKEDDDVSKLIDLVE